MRLHTWSSLRQDIEFDSASGSATVIKLPAPRPDHAVPRGFADFERQLFGTRQAFAVYRSGDAVFFNAGVRRWELGQPGLRFLHGNPFPFFSRFSVVVADRVVFTIQYPHLGRLLWAMIDPTYDGLDEEHDFFLAFVAKHAQSPEWLANVRKHWASSPDFRSAPASDT